MTSRFFRFPLLVSLAFLVSCASSQQGSSGNKTETTSTVEMNSIAFVTMQIERVSQGSKVSILDEQIKPGTFKPPLAQPTSQNTLTIESYENGALAFSQTIEHPLYKDLEYPDSSAQMHRKTAVLSETQFFFRVQMYHSRSLVKLYETFGTEPRHDLGSFELAAE